MEDATVRFGSVDWASQKHSACVVDGGGQVIDEFEVAHESAGLSALCRGFLRARVRRVAIERPDGPVVDALMDAGLEAHCVDALGAAAEPLTTRAVRSVIGAGAPALSSVHRALVRLANRGDIHRMPPIADDAAGRRVTWAIDGVPATSSPPRQQPRHASRADGATSSPRQPQGFGVTRLDSEYDGHAPSSLSFSG